MTSEKDKLRVMVCCARSLGCKCIERLLKRKDVEIIGVAVPERGWWTDINDLEFIKERGLHYVAFKEIPSFIAEKKPDLVFSILTDYIFKKEDLEICPVINLHPAPLPRYRGCNSYSHAIINGDESYGTSLHYVNEKIDQGDIIDVAEFSIAEKWTVKDLYDLSQEVALAQFSDHLPSIISAVRDRKRVKTAVQKSEEAKYYDRNSLKALKEISDISEEQFDQWYRLARGLDFPPFEPLAIVCKGRKIYLTIRGKK